MGELSIRRSGGFAVPQQREVGRAEKTSSSQSASKPAEAAVPEAPRPPAVRGQAELLLRAGRRTLRTGEAALAEVQDSLGRMAELAREAGGETPDREALQAELEQLRGTIDRILRSAVSGGTPLFLDGEGGLEEGLEALLFAVMDAAASEDADQTLPGWLEDSLSGRLPTPEELLAGLGLDKTASAEEILAAVTGGALEGGTAAGYLAALYLGSVISGGDSPAEAMEGLRRLLEKVAEGVPLDQAVEELTDGAFTGMEDFERQFTGGTAPGMQAFLSALLLAGGESLLPDGAASLLALLAGLEGGESGASDEPADARPDPGGRSVGGSGWGRDRRGGIGPGGRGLRSPLGAAVWGGSGGGAGPLRRLLRRRQGRADRGRRGGCHHPGGRAGG